MAQELLQQTAAHYDRFPFIQGGGTRIAWWRDYLRGFLSDEEVEGRSIIDVGSSVGEISRGLNDRKGKVVCLDVSLGSLRKCRELNPESPVVHGSALRLPFPDGAFDHAISIGVLHHTPDCRLGFHELARVTAPGGKVVVFLYNYWNIYNVLYNAFSPIRKRVPLEKTPRLLWRMLQPFVRLHLGQTLNDEQLRNLLGDKLWTPQATFHSVSQVRQWGIEEGLKLTRTKKFFLGYANVMSFTKIGESNPAARREFQLKCLKCQSTSMHRDAMGHFCGECGHLYPLEGGIIRCLAEEKNQA